MKQFFSNNNKDLLHKILKKNQDVLPDGLVDDDSVISEFVISKEPRNDFKMQRGPQSKGLKTLLCKICNGDQFVVGQDDYFTAIKCVNCGYELGIHEG